MELSLLQKFGIGLIVFLIILGTTLIILWSQGVFNSATPSKPPPSTPTGTSPQSTSPQSTPPDPNNPNLPSGNFTRIGLPMGTNGSYGTFFGRNLNTRYKIFHIYTSNSGSNITGDIVLIPPGPKPQDQNATTNPNPLFFYWNPDNNFQVYWPYKNNEDFNNKLLAIDNKNKVVLTGNDSPSDNRVQLINSQLRNKTQMLFSDAKDSLYATSGNGGANDNTTWIFSGY